MLRFADISEFCHARLGLKVVVGFAFIDRRALITAVAAQVWYKTSVFKEFQIPRRLVTPVPASIFSIGTCPVTIFRNSCHLKGEAFCEKFCPVSSRICLNFLILTQTLFELFFITSAFMSSLDLQFIGITLALTLLAVD